MNQSLAITFALLLITIISAQSVGEDRDPRMHRGMIFQSTFDDTTDVNLFGYPNDAGWIYTAESTQRREVLVMNRRRDVRIAKGQGRMRDSLQFTAKAPQVLFYQASPSLPKPRADWAGSVSFWLNPDAAEMETERKSSDPAEPGSAKPSTTSAGSYPFLLFDGDWRHGGFYLRLPETKTNRLELGVVSEDTTTTDPVTSIGNIPKRHHDVLTVDKGYAGPGEWSLITICFEGVNGEPGAMSNVKLYVNGKPQARLKRPLQVQWMAPTYAPGDGPKPNAAMFLGVDFQGHLDDLRVYQHSLNDEQALKLYRLGD